MTAYEAIICADRLEPLDRCSKEDWPVVRPAIVDYAKRSIAYAKVAHQRGDVEAVEKHQGHVRFCLAEVKRLDKRFGGTNET